jgi:hypothetical protein
VTKVDTLTAGPVSITLMTRAPQSQKPNFSQGDG